MCKVTCTAEVPRSSEPVPQASQASEQPVTSDHSAWRRPLVLLVLCGLLAILASAGDLQERIQELLAALRPALQEHPAAGALALILGAAISAMAAFMSIAVLVPVAVFTWGEASTMLMLWIGWVLGGVLAYGLAWHFGRRVMGWVGARSLLERCERWVDADAPFILILGLQFALPSEIPGYVLGLVRYPLHRYIAALALAELPYAVATVYLGNAFLAGRSRVILVVGVLAAVLSVLAAYALRRRMERPHPKGR